jgi:hypothetical protein
LPALPTRPEPPIKADPGPPRRPTGSESTQDRLAPVKEDREQPQPATPVPVWTQTLWARPASRSRFTWAHFVVAAAAILAAVVEAARLPILLAATALFAGGAVVPTGATTATKLCSVHCLSFLLPTDANVLADILTFEQSQCRLLVCCDGRYGAHLGVRHLVLRPAVQPGSFISWAFR